MRCPFDRLRALGLLRPGQTETAQLFDSAKRDFRARCSSRLVKQRGYGFAPQYRLVLGVIGGYRTTITPAGYLISPPNFGT